MMAGDANGAVPSDSPTAIPAKEHAPSDKDDCSLAPVLSPYSRTNVMMDLPAGQYVLELFFNSHMVEAEEYVDKGDPKK